MLGCRGRPEFLQSGYEVLHPQEATERNRWLCWCGRQLAPERAARMNVRSSATSRRSRRAAIWRPTCTSTHRATCTPRGPHKVVATLGDGAAAYDAARRCIHPNAVCRRAGFSLHAAVRCAADERKRLEQLCRYITRPALANERVQCNAAGQVVLKLKTPGRVVASGLGAPDRVLLFLDELQTGKQ